MEAAIVETGAERVPGGRPAINPYRIAASLILRRLLWDLHPQSWRSRHRLKRLQGSHNGEKAVILCTGPSLNRVDFQSLKGTYCFGLNKIQLLFPRTDFRPSCIVATDPNVVAQSADFLNATVLPLFLSFRALQHVKPRQQRTYLHIIHNDYQFARDATMSLASGTTVTYVALQLAFHMGFSRVALVGCDNSYSDQASHVVKQTVGSVDVDHFDPSYNANQTFTHGSAITKDLAYATALDAYRNDDRILVNATDGGRLEILPRMPLAEFLAL